jgi:IstB-like ATP binding protein
MLTHPTIDQLRALRLDGMADAFIELQTQDQAKDLGPAEWLALMLDREAAHRGTQRFKSRLRHAKLRHGQASIEDVDYRTPRRLDKALFQQLAAGRCECSIRFSEQGGPRRRRTDRPALHYVLFVLPTFTSRQLPGGISFIAQARRVRCIARPWPS